MKSSQKFIVAVGVVVSFGIFANYLVGSMSFWKSAGFGFTVIAILSLLGLMSVAGDYWINLLSESDQVNGEDR